MPEHWIYALVTGQTMAGYDGATKYGIARMNGCAPQNHSDGGQ
jgi:CRISPR system Cascade subunit CasA